MEILLPNNIACKYDLNSVIYKKDYKKGIIVFMKVTEMLFYGFKEKDTHIKFKGYVVKKEKLK
jgi:hypothetical protein